MALSLRSLASLFACASLVAAAGCSGSTAPNPGADASTDASADGSGDDDTFDASVDGAGKGCTTKADCPATYACGYRVTEACAAKGVCVPPPCPPDSACGPLQGPGCGCDGQPAPYVFPGYTAAPVKSPFGCEQLDGGSGTACATEKTCGNDELCVAGKCTKQCTGPAACGANAACRTDFCYGPHGCNPPPDGQACPPVCYGFCESLPVADAGAD